MFTTAITRKPIVEFQILDHGIEHSQYFPGCGFLPEFRDVATGIGMNAAEAIDDCLEQLACKDWEVDGMEQRILRQELPGKRKLPTKPAVTSRHGDEVYYHLSIRVK